MNVLLNQYVAKTAGAETDHLMTIPRHFVLYAPGRKSGNAAIAPRSKGLGVRGVNAIPTKPDAQVYRKGFLN
jgi:hypothetical protein